MESGANWREVDLADNGDWHHRLDEAEIDEIDTALRRAASTNPSLDLARITTDDFPLPDFASRIAGLRENLVNGLGFKIFEGFPVSRYRPQELRAIYWALALHIGVPVSQSKRGDLLGDVRDIGTGISGREGRGYTSNTELNFHSDPADVTGLFFLRSAKSGGVSRIASSVTVHNEIARRRPDLLEVLYRPFHWSWQGNEPPGERPYYEMPVFGRTGNELACAFVRTNILLAHDNVGAPPMSPEQVEAVELVASVAAEPGMYLERTFEPGTIAFIGNHTVFHMRTEFEDWDDAALKRHLLRVWLSLPNSGRLPDSFKGFFGDVSPGAVRGGYPSQADAPVFETV